MGELLDPGMHEKFGIPEEVFGELVGTRTNIIKKSDFDYPLKKELIARYPLEVRDEARLLVLHKKSGRLEHRVFYELPELLQPGDVVVVNNSRVFPARLIGYKETTGARIEVLLLRELKPDLHLWSVLVHPARKIRVGNRIAFPLPDGSRLIAEAIDNVSSGGRTLRFIFSGSSQELRAILRQIGRIPIPPYLRREDEEIDREYYQTIFAREEEEYSVAASTAALHFTTRLVKKLRLRQIQIVEITLHMGYASFMPIQVENLKKHTMEAEFCKIPEESARIINDALDQKRRVIAVGTSVVRALEGSVDARRRVRPGERWIDLFIYPPFEFKIVQGLITNFHAPQSTNLILVCAFGGTSRVLEAYRIAQEKRYRFLTYGDAMLILNDE